MDLPLKLMPMVRFPNRTITVNVVPDFLVGGLWKPDLLPKVGAFTKRAVYII